MTFELKACPKPTSRPKVRGFQEGRKPLQRNRKPLKRVKMRCGAGSKRRKKSSFPKQRDAKFCRFVVEETDCVGAGRLFTRQVSGYDLRGARAFLHVCWGPHDPAHVGKHRAQGAPDFGRVVNMCRALHDFYDQHRSVFAKVTGLTERKLENQAEWNALRWVERGGTPTQERT
jgi:hypothetical protein